MPTGCRSEYLSWPLAHVVLDVSVVSVVSAFSLFHAVFSGTRETLFLSVPARDLKGGAENLGSHEFCHDDGVLGFSDGGRWSRGEEWVTMLVMKLAAFETRTIGVGLGCHGGVSGS